VAQEEAAISEEVPRILAAIFQCTLEMINKDLEEFPEHRTNFFPAAANPDAVLFPRVYGHSSGTIQIDCRFSHLGLQAFHAKRG